jgi:two-component system sensor histidine kinase MprB
MPLRRRLSIIAAASVGIAILAASVICYLVVRSQLLGQVQTSLQTQARAVQQEGPGGLASRVQGIPASAGGPAQYQQVVLYSGKTASNGKVGNLDLPITAHVLRVAQGKSTQFMYEFHDGNSHLEEIVVPAVLPVTGAFGPTRVNAAVQLARPLNSVDSVLSSLRLVLLFVLIGGVLVAGMLGRIASRRVLKPLKEVERTAQHIAETDDLSDRIRVHADDEVGRLASRFNQMLDRLQGSRNALDASVQAQRQLVADASHELRTPVTSLRTNIEILLQTGELDPEERRAMLTDAVEQSEELASLVNDLIELARGDQPGPETDDVRLDWVAEEALARAHRNAPGLHFDATIEPALLDGVPERLGRALNNLLDNASRHSPPGGTIELYAGPGGVRVRDHGSGVDEEDLPYLFDRFYRGKNSRGRQGSGLGLAIVRQVTEQHGGTASVANAPNGGAVFNLRLPAVAPEAHEPDGTPTRATEPDPARIS